MSEWSDVNYLGVGVVEGLIWRKSLIALWEVALQYDEHHATWYSDQDYVPVWDAVMQHIRWLIENVATDVDAFHPRTLRALADELFFLNQIAAIHATGGKA